MIIYRNSHSLATSDNIRSGTASTGMQHTTYTADPELYDLNNDTPTTDLFAGSNFVSQSSYSYDSGNFADNDKFDHAGYTIEQTSEEIPIAQMSQTLMDYLLHGTSLNTGAYSDDDDNNNDSDDSEDASEGLLCSLSTYRIC